MLTVNAGHKRLDCIRENNFGHQTLVVVKASINLSQNRIVKKMNSSVRSAA